MKFLVVAAFAAINSFLGRLETGDSVLNGKLEGYSCKTAGTDKKLYKHLNTSLGQQIATSDNGQATSGSVTLSTSAGGLGDSLGDDYALDKFISPKYLSPQAVSPFGPLSDTGARRTFISLIQVLSASYPDYDWSSLSPEDFRKEDTLAVRNTLASMVPANMIEGVPLTVRIWGAIDAEVKIAECDIYSYKADPDHDPFSKIRTLWFFNYFFYNRKLKRVVFFTCRAISKVTLSSALTRDSPDGSDDEGSGLGGGYDEKVFDDMEY